MPGKSVLSKLQRILALALAVAIVIAIVALVVRSHDKPSVLPLSTATVKNNAMQVLRSEELLFLVTDRIVSQIVVEKHESSLLLGKREGYLIAGTRMYYGIDLKDVGPDSMAMREGKLVISLPEPKELEFAVDLDSLRFLSKRSGLMAIKDWVKGDDLRSELQSQFHDAAVAFLADNRLIPTRGKMVDRLNGYAPALSSRLGVEVVFE